MTRFPFAAAVLPLLLLAPTVAVADEPDRIACWEGDLAACDAGLAAAPRDIYWLAQAAWSYGNAGEQEQASALYRRLSREIAEIHLVHEAVERMARQEVAEGSPRRAIEAFTFLADYGDRLAIVTHINQTGGSPHPPDSHTRQAMDDIARQARGDALEGRGIAHILAGDADAAIADLRAALEYGRLRETLLFLRERGIDYQGAGRFSISVIDAELEALLRDLAGAP